MGFERGDIVEILNKEEGLKGSYYPANIISRVSNKDYIVQYRTLLEEDGSGPLREFMSTDRIRPTPREIVADAFRLSEVVDAYDRDGWWVGKVIGKTGSKYVVHFKGTGEKIAYPLDRLRVHQEWDWKNGVWYFG
ncbi:putative Agenet-like domain-containing protein [Helianthus annuus]|uniref:Agenet-like domain-containing protein n=1 Tax=Helianthus annuus TaxID=4232 RepID=A0A9K3DJB5_HELAN|nr:putative Agenet-like domain-containing protein [Helianthus annuus]KAJ0429961.1 putative Agenet-like domain-containing protein [Helianthus annuus]KAJ0434692.1 putative Agenet-like domain-containing protein [Helianthus annuus]KAJ0448396.1 putative Agenet-like domain-containing protein [Helianthus annuus]KAJ0633284.1 putative Agenet-like domain-containing protein [Helianthus annuus]